MSHFNVSLARGLGTMTRPANTIAGDDNVEHVAASATTMLYNNFGAMVSRQSQKSHRKVTDSHGCQMQTPLGTTMRLRNYKLYWLYCTR